MLNKTLILLCIRTFENKTKNETGNHLSIINCVQGVSLKIIRGQELKFFSSIILNLLQDTAKFQLYKISKQESFHVLLVI